MAMLPSLATTVPYLVLATVPLDKASELLSTME